MTNACSESSYIHSSDTRGKCMYKTTLSHSCFMDFIFYALTASVRQYSILYSTLPDRIPQDGNRRSTMLPQERSSPLTDSPLEISQQLDKSLPAIRAKSNKMNSGRRHLKKFFPRLVVTWNTSKTRGCPGGKMNRKSETEGGRGNEEKWADARQGDKEEEARKTAPERQKMRKRDEKARGWTGKDMSAGREREESSDGEKGTERG